MWINIGAVFETLAGTAITFVLQTVLLVAVCGILQLLWNGIKWIYHKIIGKKYKKQK